jgi:hypothetical protein
VLARFAAGIVVFGLGLSAAAAQFGNDVETIVVTGRVMPVSGIKIPYTKLDFDGDGASDDVYVVSVSAGKESLLPSKAVQIPGLWGGHKIGTGNARRALEIVLGGKTRHMFLITDVEPNGGYFDTPLWSGTTPPVSVAKRGSKTFREFQKQEKRIQHDVLVLGTEAGIDTALYWNGTTFALVAPNEEP